MKNKRILTLIILIAVMTLSSCGLIFGEVADSGAVSVVIENTDGSYLTYEAELGSVENKSEGARGILDHLKNGESRLQFIIQDGPYGAYLTGIGPLRESVVDKNYVMVYTSVASDSYEGAPTVEYNGVTLYQSGVGLSGMSIEAGTVIMFRLEKSPY